MMIGAKSLDLVSDFALMSPAQALGAEHSCCQSEVDVRSSFEKETRDMQAIFFIFHIYSADMALFRRLSCFLRLDPGSAVAFCNFTTM